MKQTPLELPLDEKLTMRLFQWTLLVIGVALTVILAFQQLADPMFIVGGSTVASIYSVPLSGVLVSVGLYFAALAVGAAGLQRNMVGCIVLPCAAVASLVLSTHQVIDDAVHGTISDQWAAVPIQSVEYPVADGSPPLYERDGVTTLIVTAHGEMKVFSGFQPWSLNLPDAGPN